MEVVAGTLKLTSGDPLLGGPCGGYSQVKTDLRGSSDRGAMWRL
jgi:hypothetical protein